MARVTENVLTEILTMKIKFFTVLLGLFTSLNMNAQELKSFTLEDLNFGGKNYRNFVPQNRNFVWWGDQLVRVESDACYLVNKQNGKETQLFTVSQVHQWAGPTKDIKVRPLRGASFPYADTPLVVTNTRERSGRGSVFRCHHGDRRSACDAL